uniref:Proline-, glutamic acid- and leucine-rich protein 1-like n=1 Tax=Crassostrea virginica TaxID=6565 RepID=A0A8B8C8I8_CRAVI|nr:proline-, glutamic acid- and leucine-rich protein 1-like [Crassostrea virginica]
MYQRIALDLAAGPLNTGRVLVIQFFSEAVKEHLVKKLCGISQSEYRNQSWFRWLTTYFSRQAVNYRRLIREIEHINGLCLNFAHLRLQCGSTGSEEKEGERACEGLQAQISPTATAASASPPAQDSFAATTATTSPAAPYPPSMDPVRTGYTGRISIRTDGQGNREVKEEPLDPGFRQRMRDLEESFTGVNEGPEKRKTVPPPRPPPPKTPPAAAAASMKEEGEWLTTRRNPLTSTPRRPPRWVSPPPQRPQSPPPPYQGIIVTEAPQRPRSPPPPYGEVMVQQNGDAVRVVSRAVIPSAPPRDEGYGSASSSSSSSTGSRGTVRPHSVSPFLRNIRQRLEKEGNEEEEVDLEAIACLLDFSTRERGRACTPSQTVTTTVSSFKIAGPSGSQESNVLVRTFATSPPTTPAPAPRPERPPPITTNLRHTCHSCVRPRALRNAPPAAALGAPPRPGGGGGRDRSPRYSGDPSLPCYERYNRDQVNSDEEYFSELEYVDPYEGEGPISSTPPPSRTCTTPYAASNVGTLPGAVSAYGGICGPSTILAALYAERETPAEKILWGRTSAGSSLYAGQKSWFIDEGEEEEEEGEEEEEEEEEYLVERYYVALGAVPAEDCPPKKKEKKIEPKEEQEEVEEEEEEPP